MTYSLSHSEFNALHVTRGEVHEAAHKEARRNPDKADRKLDREMAKMASMFMREWLNTELWLHVDLNKA